MLRFISFCLCLMLCSCPGTAALANKGGLPGAAAEEASTPGKASAADQRPEAVEIRALLKKGRALENARHGYRALSVYQEAMQRSQKDLGPEHLLTAACMARLAQVYSLLGYFGKALPLAQKSLKIREKALGPEHPQTADSQIVLGFLYDQMGAHEKALRLSQQALRSSEKALGPEAPLTAAALMNLAIIYAQMGAYDRALPYARRSVQIREKVLGPENLWTAVSLKVLGSIYLRKKDYGQAESCFRRAKHHQGEQGMVQLYLATGRDNEALDLLLRLAPQAWMPPQYQVQYYTQKGLALMGAGRYKQALAAFSEAIRRVEELRARTPGERASFFEGGRMGGYALPYRGMVGLLAGMAQKGRPVPPDLQIYGRDNGAVAFYFAESIKARSLLEAVAAGAAKSHPQLSPDLAAREKRLQEEIQTLEAQRLDRFQERGRGWESRELPVQEFEGAREALQKKLDKFVAELRRRDPRYAALNYPQPYKAHELPLKSGEVLLEYSLGKKESFLFRVEPGGKTRVFRLALGQEELEKRLGAMLAPFRQSVLRREDLARFSIKDAASLYQKILAPALSGVAPGTRLVIVPDGALGAFPLEALVVQAGPDWGKCVLVGDRWPVTYSQSAAILALNRHLGISKAKQPLFALGDCIYARGSSRYQAYKAGQGQAGELKSTGSEKALTMAATGREWGRLEFPPLPATRRTVLELAALFHEKPQPPQVLLDVNATETKVRRAPLGQYRYLFFGTHGFLADKLAGVQEPTLVLTQVENKAPDDGFLTFSNVLQLKLDADLVTLAACMTGVGQVMQGEGVLNFARAFQQAGARSVMVALWNIPVDESLKFYHDFYQALKAGKSKIEALKIARQAVRAKEGHPYFWSGIILHGEG
jgi:CHAT domain-containing protein